jgi:hypothetical protein
MSVAPTRSLIIYAIEKPFFECPFLKVNEMSESTPKPEILDVIFDVMSNPKLTAAEKQTAIETYNEGNRERHRRDYESLMRRIASGENPTAAQYTDLTADMLRQYIDAAQDPENGAPVSETLLRDLWILIRYKSDVEAVPQRADWEVEMFRRRYNPELP